jgi:excisionase family DNA binding protein
MTAAAQMDPVQYQVIDPNGIYTEAGIAACFGVSERTVRRWITSGDLAFVRIGGQTKGQKRIRGSAALDYLARRESPTRSHR